MAQAFVVGLSCFFHLASMAVLHSSNDTLGVALFTVVIVARLVDDNHTQQSTR
jgi:hypothetical protein